jgi:hypothetical protein
VRGAARFIDGHMLVNFAAAQVLGEPRCQLDAIRLGMITWLQIESYVRDVDPLTSSLAPNPTRSQSAVCLTHERYPQRRRDGRGQKSTIPQVSNVNTPASVPEPARACRGFGFPPVAQTKGETCLNVAEACQTGSSSFPLA